ncbi:hypothetical protein LAZ67_11001581 [Cordylochernes scorpioides]|uniref:CCHC-type domain-containing protein n=1 Tax=Cordylochernes scorpioides TaxID=51811 RepID=A0ABY6L2E1_9ARAC|nr:hypothetical protein LAZ67_11001581 [Cordylochernes scorpioides]
MQNIDILKRARAPKRAIFTRLSTEFWTEIEKPDFDTEKYRAKYNRICALSKEISEIDSRYHGLLLEDETITEVKIEEEFEGCENYVQGMFDIENKYLSRLELPKFKGNLEDWLSWWGQFSKINDDETLGDVNKFHYLLQAVVEGSRAQRLVCSYPISEVNYPKVIQALKDRFGDKNLLIEHYIRKLLKLVVSNARKENLPLDEIYDDLTAHLKNLESLGVNTEMAGVFLYPLVESSLPLDIIQVWQRNPAVGYGIKEEGAENGDKSDASGRLQALMDFLRDEVKGAERMAFAKENFEGNSSMRATGSQLKTPRKTPPTGNHLKRECRADIKCRNCRKDHLDIFCNKIALKQGGNNSFKGETSKVVNEGNATCTGVNMSARACANDILLMTSVAKLKGAKETKEVKVLFDTGSHYSYIKRSIVEKLGLNIIGEISLEKYLFGGGNMKEALHGKYVLKLGSLTNKIDVDIVALDQPEICAKIPPIPRGRLLYKLKRKKIYIHPSNFRNEEIDILIGSDYFGQLLTGKVVHLGEDLTAVETQIRMDAYGAISGADIRKAFQMITVQLQDQDFLRFLWWDQTDPIKLTVFRQKRVVFGLNCSPFILGAVIDHHLNSVQGPAAEIAMTMARSFYMDNLVTSLSSQEEVQQFQNTAVNIMEMAKMDLREWEFNLPVSNSKEEKGTTTKVLGLVWDKVEAVLNCDVSIEKDFPRRLTQTMSFPELEKIRVNSFTRKYKILSKLNEELKQRFRKEYLGVLMQRPENKRERCIKEGDSVLIGQDNTKRILWPVGKIIKLYLGKDGVNRVARVKTSTGEWLRPVQRLFSLEISSEETPEKVSEDKKPLTIKTRSGREVRKPIRFAPDNVVARPPDGPSKVPTDQLEGRRGQKGQGAGARVGVTAVPTRQEKILAGACPRGAPGSSSIFHKRPYKRSEKGLSGADTPRQSYKQRLVDGTTSKKIPRAESRGRKDVEENPTSRVSWTGKDALEYPSSSNLRTEKDVLDNQRVVTIRQPTRDNWTSHKTRKACDGAATPEEMDALKKRRKAIRGTFTRIINEINGEFEKSQIDRNDIYSKFNRLESYYTKLVDLNEKYQALLVVKEGITEESIDREWQECDKYEEEKFDIQQKVSVLRNPNKEETIPIASEDTVINVKLPELALKSYDGSLEGWLSWWAQFSKIHENKNLSDSDRFLYLRQAIVPNSEAYRVVASYPVTGANYALAVQALQERFGDPNILTELYVRRLLNSVISNVKKENRNLSSLYDELSSHLRSLETLGIDPQLSGIFLYPLVESSLPSDILKIWHRHPSSGYGMELAKREESDKGVGGAQERLRLLLDFLKAEVRSAQRLKFVEKDFKQEEPYKRSYNDGTRTRNNFRPATVSSLFGGRTNIKCFFCERTNHASHQCRSIMKMSPGERNDKIRSAHLCFKCLRKGHIQSQCREQLECKNCGRNHLEVLCEGNSSNRLTKPGRENLKENATEPIASLSSQACTGQVLLMTTVALLRGPNASRRVRILLDSGSQFSYIKQSLVWSIGIERKGEITIAKSLFGGNKIGEEKHGKFMLELENLGNKRDVIHIEALDQRKICDAIPPLPKGDWLEKLKIKGIILSQDNFKGQEIDILIGANYLGMILTGKIVQVEADLTAVETKLGWTLMGNSPIIDSNDNVQQTLNLLTTRCDLKDLWDLEVLGIRDPVETCSKETRYQEIKEKFITKIQRQSDQRYSVGLPWKVEKESIPSNLDIAIKRLDISTKKMTSQNKLTEYSQIFRDWLTEGLIERVEENPLERRGYYLPHRPVYKMESKTTPIRPVFDASCLGHNGLSLNQCLEKGPNLLERIPEMMIRFRENKFGVTADIRKAFQMVAIEESERNYLRFLWWEKESDRELIAYRHKRLVFGLNCSPFVLNAVIEYHLQSIRGPLVQCAKILAQSFYMDNCITSLETKQEVQEFQKAAIEIMDRAKMDLREWEYSLEENPEKGTCTKILGVVWNKMEDSLKCELPDILSLQPKLTKRLVLSMVQRIFDPLGFCAPVFLPPKLLLQRSWGLKLGWDTPLPESMAQEFRTWLDQIKLIELIKIPRYMWNDLIFPTEVHIFCDASQIGYGAVAYLRSETGRENTLTLIWSKVRLAPMKSITIPRLELMAMVLGARLANAIQAALKRKCETTLWSDSTTALSWIKKEIEWRVFVRNRVREIQATTNLNDWRFVPSQLNPADLLSRGCPPSQFVQSRWWEGPEWLKKPKEFWPNSEFSINPKEIKEMLIKMLGHRKLKYVQLQTALCEIESIINNRPLTYVSEDDNDLKPLTPNEFLQNGPESSFPEFENLKPEMLHTRYRELGQLKRELKQRFLKEYLGALIHKSENIDRRQLKVGDVVLIGQENLKRMFWPKGRIVNLIPGKDGIVRVAPVKTSTGTLIRALQRLHPLEISSNVETIQKDNSNTEPQSDAFLGNRPNIESRDSRNRYGGADTPRQTYKQRLVDGTTSKKIPRAESRGRKDVEENPTSRVSWTGKDALEYPSSSNLRTEKDVLDNQRVVTIRQPTRDNWTSHKTRKACDGAATPEVQGMRRKAPGDGKAKEKKEGPRWRMRKGSCGVGKKEEEDKPKWFGAKEKRPRKGPDGEGQGRRRKGPSDLRPKEIEKRHRWWGQEKRRKGPSGRRRKGPSGLGLKENWKGIRWWGPRWSRKSPSGLGLRKNEKGPRWWGTKGGGRIALVVWGQKRMIKGPSGRGQGRRSKSPSDLGPKEKEKRPRIRKGPGGGGPRKGPSGLGPKENEKRLMWYGAKGGGRIALVVWGQRRMRKGPSGGGQKERGKALEVWGLRKISKGQVVGAKVVGAKGERERASVVVGPKDNEKKPRWYGPGKEEEEP